MTPLLEPAAASLNYADLPETWRVPEIGRFSGEKTLYDYQKDALEKAARALFLYYGWEHDWVSGESPAVDAGRKQHFAGLYRDCALPALKKYETRADERNQNESPVFRILSGFMPPAGDRISYHNLINRMCFWMATGSGKTIVMVKLIEYLHALKTHGEIPPYNILILAPSPHLIGQIRKTVGEFNATGLQIDLVPLRQIGRTRQTRLGDAVTVYYHRSDNISDVQKEALTDYRHYENGGRWYILLDEAHKGGKEDSKRQAYYAVMARRGFLFNFSATFTDHEDIITTVKKYNLEEFIKNGHGKNIYLNEGEYDAFQNRKEEINHGERRKIVLKSLITLACISTRVGKLREQTGLEKLYHLPLMLTLVNSVNTDNDRNDLWAFFQTLREIATGEIDESFFTEARDELRADWQNTRFLFREDGGGVIRMDDASMGKMKITDLRLAVFLGRRKGGLQVIRSSDGKELAFQLKNADSPFALIRIGDTSRWRNELLAGYEETTALQKKSFFDELEQSQITILMGSRSFFESWDSNRPNVINFINIGGRDAKKFVVQSVGRGVRIETLPNERRRLSHVLPTLEGKIKFTLEKYHNQVQPPETLFLFATNRAAIKAVLEGLEGEKKNAFEKLEGFEKAPVAKIGNRDMPLLVPEYREISNHKSAQARFAMSAETLSRLKSWFEKTSDSVLTVRDGLDGSQIAALRNMVEQSGKIRIRRENEYVKIPFLQNRLVSHLTQTVKTAGGVRKVDDDDIVHFRQIRVHPEYTGQLQEKIRQVGSGRLSDNKIAELTGKLMEKKITREEYDEKVAGKDDDTFKELTIRKLFRHYYFPVVLGEEKAHYIQHIIKVKSEIDFLNALEVSMENNEVLWDAWMFSKIDESLDKIHIPYYDANTNEYRSFLPDFVFWMCRGDEYRIVFVDPKGAAHTSVYHKIDGYKQLFETPSGCLENPRPTRSPRSIRQFCYGQKWRVSVDLLIFNPNQPPAAEYRPYWIDDPAGIFHTA